MRIPLRLSFFLSLAIALFSTSRLHGDGLPTELETPYGLVRALEWSESSDNGDPSAYGAGFLESGLAVSLTGHIDLSGHFNLANIFPQGEYIAGFAFDLDEIDRILAQSGFTIDRVRSRSVGTLLRVSPDFHSLDEMARAHRLLESRFALAEVEPNLLVLPTGTPNDPDYAAAWTLAKLELEAVWERYGFAPDGGLGRPPVIAVVDNGAPEAADFQMWINEGEIPGNGIDDDQNGYIDDVNGYNFRWRKGDLSYVGSHGTKVARIAAAQSNNGYGTASPASHASLMRCIYYENVNGSHFNGLEGMLYAIENGADVVNCSFVTNSQMGFNTVFEAANKANVVIVGAAGPGRKDLGTIGRYPAGLDEPRVLSVGASDRQDRLGNSNFGLEEVDLFAPGNTTSFATPLVTSTVALLRSLRPQASPEELIAAVIAGVDRIPALEGLCVSGGRLNVRGAVEALIANVDDNSGPIEPDAPVLVIDEVGIGRVDLSWSSEADVESHELQFRISGGEWEPPVILESHETETRLDGLTYGTLYEIRLRSWQGEAASAWVPLEVATPGPIHEWDFTVLEDGTAPDTGTIPLPLQLPAFLLRDDSSLQAGLGFQDAHAGSVLVLPHSTGMNDNLLTAYSISLWVRPDVGSHDRTAVLFEQGDFWRGLNVLLDEGFLHANAWNRPATESDWAGTALWGRRLYPGEWSHVVLVLDVRGDLEEGDQSGLILYLNGEQVARGPAYPVHPHRGGAGLGGIAGSTVFLNREVRQLQPFSGSIRELSIWNLALSPAQVETMLVEF